MASFRILPLFFAKNQHVVKLARNGQHKKLAYMYISLWINGKFLILRFSAKIVANQVDNWLFFGKKFSTKLP